MEFANVILVDCIGNVMAHAQKPDFVFQRNGIFHLNRQGLGGGVGGVSSVDCWQPSYADQRSAIVLSLASTLITA